MTRIFKWITLSAVIFILVGSCVKQNFDVPPIKSLSDLEANTSIADLKAKHRNGNVEDISDDIVISGIVISDDKEGNFYKQLIIQDETGGIELRIDETNLSVDYPLGKRVFVKCKGLSLTDYNSFIQLGFQDNRIPTALVENFVEVGELEGAVVPKSVLIHNLTTNDVGTLIQLNEVEVSKSDNGKSFADTSANAFSGTNRTIEDCFGNNILLRTSRFANFASETMPSGNGTLVGVLSVFRNDFQFLIRNSDDMNMPNDPCNRSAGNASLMNISELKALFNSGSSSITENRKIVGTVISDGDNSNITNKNLVIQDASAGITIRFAAAHSYKLNDKIELEVSGLTLDEYNGLLQISNVPLGNANLLGIGNVTPVAKSIAEIIADFESFESTLVRLSKVTVRGGSIWGDFGIVVKDETGELNHYTTSYASFKDEALPTNEFDLIGIIGQGGNDREMQIYIRNLDDIIGGNNGGGGGGSSADTLESFTEDFSSFTDQADINMNGWTSMAIQGSRVWRTASFSGNNYAQATAFNDTEPQMETMLFTPPLNLDRAKKISFQSAAGFQKHDGLSIWISTDFDRKDYQQATWVELSANLANKTTEEHKFIDSGDVDLSSFSGIGYIGFRYIGDGANNTTSYRIDNIVFGDK